MKSRILSAALAALLILSLAACGSQPKTTDPAAADPTSAAPQSALQPVTPPAQSVYPDPAALTDVLALDGTLLGKIDARAAATAADDGIFYRLWVPSDSAAVATAEYHFFRTADRTDVLLGALENESYEVYYARTELDGTVYTLALEGNPMDDDPDTLWLLAVNGKEGKMSRCAVSDHGYPYASMAASNGKILIMNHEMTEPKTDAVYEFDPATGAIRTVLSFPAKDNNSLRAIAPDGDGFCLFRVHVNGSLPDKAFLDRYDSAYNKTSETDLTELFSQEAQKIPGVADGIMSELGMMISAFRLEEGRYLFYENFAITRLILDLETGTSLLAENDLFSMTPGGGAPAIFYLEFDGSAEPNIRLLKNGALEPVALHPTDSCTQLRGLSHSPAGSWLACLADNAGAAPNALVFWQEP